MFEFESQGEHEHCAVMGFRCVSEGETVEYRELVNPLAPEMFF